MKIYYKTLNNGKLNSIGFCDETIFEHNKLLAENEGFEVVILLKQEFDKLCNEGF